MELRLLSTFTEKLRVQSIGDPAWVEAKSVFEYCNPSIEIVAVLKVIRAAQGVHALELLCRTGLFIDMGAIYRCIDDCNSEVYFLLENYPSQSAAVQRFVSAFFSATIDSDLSANMEYVQTRKIHSAVARILNSSEQSDTTRGKLQHVYKTFCGYTHANYAHIMEMYGGNYPNRNFNIQGVASLHEREKRMELVKEAYLSVLYSLLFIAKQLKLNDLFKEVWSHHESLTT
jgi:hypothetical protein